MKFGILPKKTKFKHYRFLKFYFIGGSIAIMVLFIIYTGMILRNIREEIRIVPDLYAKFIGLPADVNLEEFLLHYFMTEIIPEIDYPIVVADSLRVPVSWENIGIEQKHYSELTDREQNLLERRMKRMENRNSVIPLRYDMESDEILGYVYFGESRTMRQLRYMPYIEIVLVIGFLVLGVWGLFSIKRTEKDLLWIGLAKETAHQFGTPISSLLGWTNILSMRLQGKDEEMHDMLDCMRNDLKRLQVVVSRFGKIGSTITRKKTNLHNLIKDTIEYFSLRLPSASKKITIKFESTIENLKIAMDADLVKWTFENVIKNSVDAMRNKGGEIIIRAFEDEKYARIQIHDEGVGIPKNIQRRIFEPGTTDKERGWGLGLSLSCRIIEDYHGGKIHVLESETDKGTVIEIMLPKEER